jgi:endonuclease/exonuclease/phosphatase (EEP) superfamily protein YafD
MAEGRPRSARRRLGIAVALGGAAATMVLPDRLRLDHRFPFVGVAAFRPLITGSALTAAALLATRPRSRLAAALVGAVGLAGAGAVVGRVSRRPAPAPAPADLTILTVNVLNGRADTGELATLVAREAPDFVVLPEAGSDFRDKLMPLVETLGYQSWVSTPPGAKDGKSVTLLAARRAGDVRVRSGSGMRLRHLEATGGVLGARILFAVHTTAPMSRRRAARWQRDLAVVEQWCRAPVAPIVAGDFNATLDHSPLRAAVRGCRSAAAGTGRGLVGTYPSSVPPWRGIQIDHVFVPAGTVTTRFEVVDVAGSDHRGVLARVRLSAASTRREE